MKTVPALAPLVTVLALAACGGGDKTPADAGRTDYLRACATCHGHDGNGMGRLGNRIRDTEFLDSRSDEELVEFLKTGRAPSDPENESGMPMPPRGGDPRLTDEDLKNIVAYIRTL